MKKIIKNNKISSEVMNLKYMLLTILAVSIVMVIINGVTLTISGSNTNTAMFGKLTFANLLPFIATFSIVLIQINTYRGLPILKSFSVSRSDINSYYITTTAFYSLLLYIVLFIIIGYPLYIQLDFTNMFAFGYYLENLSFINYIKISIMIYSIVLLIIMFFQLFTIVGQRYGVWINLGLISLSVATMINFVIPIFITIRSGIDKWLVFGTIYVASIVVFMVCYYLQRGLEVTK